MAKSKSIFARGFKTGAERKGVEQRRLLGLAATAPLDAFTLATHLHIEVCAFTTLLSDEEAQRLMYPADPKQEISAFWMHNCDGDPIILHNPAHSVRRQQSDIMHEIAHIMLGHTCDEATRRICIQFGLQYYNKLQEEEAKFLGGCLQITRDGLLWALRKRYSTSEIADFYNASEEMVRFRINATGAQRQRSHETNKK